MSSLPSLSSIEFANSYTIALVCEVLAKASIPSLAYGIAALQCYNVELCVIDIELVVRDKDTDLARAKLAESGLLVVSDPPGPVRDDYGRKDLQYLEPPSSAAAAWNDFSRKVYIVVYPESAVRIDVIADVDTGGPQTGEAPHHGSETSDASPGDTTPPKSPLKYHIPNIMALRQSFLHRFLTSASAEEEARMEMLLAYLHRELKKPHQEYLLFDVSADLKPCLDLVLRGNAGFDERKEVKQVYSDIL